MLLIAAGGATTLALGLAPGPIPLLVVRVVAAGRVRGNLTLLQATAVTDRWGVTRYGSLSGLLAAPATVAAAIAPWAGASLAEILGGYPHMSTVLSVASLAAASLAAAASASALRLSLACGRSHQRRASVSRP